MGIKYKRRKISVALCTCNGEKYIHSQLNSIFNQTHLPDEIIICDDNSEDDTFNLVRGVTKESSIKIQIIKNTIRLNVVRNFEKAISLCTGDIIFLSDQDDIWMSDKVEKIYSYFDENPKINVVFTNAHLIDDNDLSFTDKTLFDAVNFTGLTQQYFMEGFGIELLNIENRITGATMAFRKKYVSQLLPFPELNGVVHDELIALPAIVNQSIGFLDDCLMNYRIHSDQKLGLGQWINLPPDSDIFKYSPTKEVYRHLDFFANDADATRRISFNDKRGKIIKSAFGLFFLIFSISDYKKYYSKYASVVIKDDISNFFKINATRLKRIIHA